MKLSRIVVTGLVCISLVFSAENATISVHKPGKVKSKVDVITGKIISADAVNSTLIIKVKNGKDTLSVEQKTVIRSGNKVIALSDLIINEAVTVSYKKVDGKKMAIRIMEKK